MIKKILFFGISFLLLGSFVQKKEKPQILRTAAEKDVRSLIPYLADDYDSTQVIRMLYEGLLRKNSTGEIIPAIAKSYDVSPDKKRYTFHLRKTRWSNGVPITAHDFAYAWKHLIDPKSGLSLACDFHFIKNAKKCSEGKVGLDSVGIQVIDDYTLAVELEHPNPYFPSFVASTPYSPVYRPTNRDRKGKSAHISNGPFCLKEWKPNYSISLVKNKNYWDAESVKLSGVDIQIIPDPITQIYLYNQGKLDYVGSPFSSFSDPDSLTDPSLQKDLHRKQIAQVTGLMINKKAYPFTNHKLVKALSLALNRKKIVEHVLRIGGSPATGFLSGCLKISDQTPLKDNHPNQAKQLFNEALKELGVTLNQFPTISISHRNLPQTKRIMAIIQEEWQKTFGIQVKLKSRDYKAHMDALFNGQYEVADVSWCSKVEDPKYVLSFFYGKDLRMNLANWESKKYCRLLDLATEEGNLEKRKELLKQAEDIFLQELPMIPIYFVEGIWLQKPSLKKVTVFSLKQIDFKEAYFSSR